MRHILLPFLKKMVIAALILAVLMIITFTYFLPSFYIPLLPFLLIFVFGFTCLSFVYLVKTAGNHFGKFIRKTMIVTVLRLFVYVLVTVLYALFIKENLLCFVTSLGIFYLVFNSLEVYELILGTGKLIINKNKT
jgi:uncharacterized membrane protein